MHLQIESGKASSVNVTTYYSEETGVSATDNFQPVETSKGGLAVNVVEC